MSRKTATSSKTTSFGNTRSKALNSTKRTWKANMQKVKITDEGGNKQTIFLSAREIKTMKKAEKK